MRKYGPALKISRKALASGSLREDSPPDTQPGAHVISAAKRTLVPTGR